MATICNIIQLVHLKRLTYSRALISSGWVSRSWWSLKPGPSRPVLGQVTKVSQHPVSIFHPPCPPKQLGKSTRSWEVELALPPRCWEPALLNHSCHKSKQRRNSVTRVRFAQPPLGHYIDSIIVVRQRMQTGSPIHNLQLNQILIFVKTIANSIRNSKRSMDQSGHIQLALIGTSPERYILYLKSRDTQRGVKFFLDFEKHQSPSF